MSLIYFCTVETLRIRDIYISLEGQILKYIFVFSLLKTEIVVLIKLDLIIIIARYYKYNLMPIYSYFSTIVLFIFEINNTH